MNSALRKLETEKVTVRRRSGDDQSLRYKLVGINGRLGIDTMVLCYAHCDGTNTFRENYEPSDGRGKCTRSRILIEVWRAEKVW